MGHAVMQDMESKLPNSAPSVIVDSAGTGGYHIGSPPDPRTMDTLRRHGINNFDHGAREVHSDDFSCFDYIMAMDSENLDDLLYEQQRIKAKARGKGGAKEAKVMLFGDFGGRGKEEIDDPYYGRGDKGFDVAYEQCVRFSKGWFKQELGIDVE